MIIIIFATLLIGCSSQESNHSQMRSISGELEITDSWVRPAVKGTNSAAYLAIYNGTAEADTLISIESKDVENAEVHESYTTEEGLSGMRPAGILAIPSGDSLVLEPGGYHIMLMKAKKDMKEGDSLSLVFRFSNAKSKDITAPVKK